MAKTVAIIQSNYIPWKGYFDIIRQVDEFILFDDVQYTRRDWRNRNQIKTPQGVQWLTIPVEVKGRYTQLIKDTRISDPGWAAQHWKTLLANYRRAPHFDDHAGVIERLYLDSHSPWLSEINRQFIETICGLLGIDTRLSWSTDYPHESGRNSQLLSLCLAAGADCYVSGPSAQCYLDEALFREHGISIRYASYEGYPPYHQAHGPFVHGVSILDLLFNEGNDSARYLQRVEHGSGGLVPPA